LTFIPSSSLNNSVQDSKSDTNLKSAPNIPAPPITSSSISNSPPALDSKPSAQAKSSVRTEQEVERSKAQLERNKIKREALEAEEAKRHTELAELKATQLAEKKSAMQRARWRKYQFPAPNAGLVVFTIMPDGNPACASYDSAHCLWGYTYDQIDFGKIKPLICGEGHRIKWGVTGYEDPKHWCNLSKTVHANPS
jgi:hypothetical protein